MFDVISKIKRAFVIYNTFGKRELLYRLLKKFSPRFATILKGGYNCISSEQLYSSRFPYLQPILKISVPGGQTRINLLIPGFEKKNVFGGVATAFIVSSIIARKLGAELRIVSTDSSSDMSCYYDLMKFYKIELPAKVSYVDASVRVVGAPFYLAVVENDFFVSTIWWTAFLAKDLSIKNKFLYLIQEFEPIFYPSGDENLLSLESYKIAGFVPYFNTDVLQKFFNHNHQYLGRIFENNFFQPSLPVEVAFPSPDSFGDKSNRRIFLYARPSTSRNLFFRAIKVLEHAFLTKVFDKSWEIYFAGEPLGFDLLIAGSKVNQLGKLSYKEYFDFAKTVDICFSLMAAPHPSYPPFDFIASGAIVVTNDYAFKSELKISDNLILSGDSVNELLEALLRAKKMVYSKEVRELNFEKSKVSRSWEDSISQNFEIIVSELGIQ